MALITPSPTAFQPLVSTQALNPTYPSVPPSPGVQPTEEHPVCPGGSCLATSAPPPTGAVTSAPFEVEGIPIPLSAIRIVEPGQLSKIVSPLNVEVQALLGESGVVRIELLGEDGRFINREVLRYGFNNGQRIFINKLVEFELPGTSEAARLQVVTEDNAGRTVSLSSVDLVLLKYGEADITAAPPTQEPLTISQPYSGQVFSGGKMTVSGVTTLAVDRPLYLDLVGNEDNIVGSRQVLPNHPEQDGYSGFQVEVPYSIQKSMWARLTIHQNGSRLPGDTIVRSVLVYLNP